MIPQRTSKAIKPNPSLTEAKPDKLGNSRWIRKHAPELLREGSLLLFGGSSLLDFRLRVAQSHARNDLLPSFWSHAAIITIVRGNRCDISEVSLDPPRGFGEVPRQNACQENKVSRYDDPERWPNLAILSFPVAGDDVRKGIEQVRRNRGSIDLSALLIPWLGFVWGAGNSPNPLLQEKGIPGAVFVETVMGLAGIDLTPGLSSQASCPEAIWQSAKWWHAFYEETSQQKKAPRGAYVLRQRSAVVVE